MTEFIELAASNREVGGKANRRLAEANVIPAVVYGFGVESTPVSLERHGFELIESHHESLGTAIFKVSMEGAGTLSALVKEIQKNPVNGRILHVDLLSIDMSQTLQTQVPLHYTGDAPGVDEGGILTASLNEIDVECLPTDLPDSIDVDVSTMAMGDSLHVSDIVAPEGITILADPEAIIVSITAPRVAEEEEEALEEAAEPALVGEEEARGASEEAAETGEE